MVYRERGLASYDPYADSHNRLSEDGELYLKVEQPGNNGGQVTPPRSSMSNDEMTWAGVVARLCALAFVGSFGLLITLVMLPLILSVVGITFVPSDIWVHNLLGIGLAGFLAALPFMGLDRLIKEWRRV